MRQSEAQRSRFINITDKPNHDMEYLAQHWHCRVNILIPQGGAGLIVVRAQQASVLTVATHYGVWFLTEDMTSLSCVFPPPPPHRRLSIPMGEGSEGIRVQAAQLLRDRVAGSTLF